MTHGACHLLRDNRPDVYVRSIQQLTLRSYFARIDKNGVLCKDGLNLLERGWLVSPRRRRTYFGLCATKANEGRRHSNRRVRKLLFDLPGVSRPLSPLCQLTRRGFHPQKLERVLNCATFFRPPDDAPHQHATRCDPIARQNRSIESIVWHRL